MTRTRSGRVDRQDFVRFNTVIPRLLHGAVRRAVLADGVRLRVWVTEALEEHLAAVRGSEGPPGGNRKGPADVLGRD